MGCSNEINPIESKCNDLPMNVLTFKESWIVREDDGIIQYGRDLIVHPYTFCRFLACNKMYDQALDMLHKRLYQMIDSKFGLD